MEVLYSLLDTLLPFEWTEFSYMKNALLAILLITPLFGLVGTMIVNNKMSFFSDALGHSALTGIAIGVMMGIDNYLISMMGFALLFALCISAVMSSGTSSADTIIGVFSSTGMALGIVLLSASGGFAKYSGYLIGDILTVQPEEIGMLAVLLVLVVAVWVLFFNKFLLTSINSDLAASKNIRTRLVEKLFVAVSYTHLLPGGQELIDSITPYLSSYDALLLGNHGALSLGHNLESAYSKMETVEYLAQLSMNIRIIGRGDSLSKERIQQILDKRAKENPPGRHPGYVEFTGV